MKYLITFDIRNARYKGKYEDVYGILEEIGAERPMFGKQPLVESAWILESEYKSASDVLKDAVDAMTRCKTIDAGFLKSLRFLVAPLSVLGEVWVLINGGKAKLDSAKVINEIAKSI